MNTERFHLGHDAPQGHTVKADPTTKFRGVTAALTLLASVGLVAAGPAMGGTADAAVASRFSYTGSAYGTMASVGTLIKSGPSAALTHGCTSNGNIHRINSTAGINIPPLAKTGVVTTTGDTYASPVRSRSSASTAGVNLLNGLVRASVIKAGSSTTKTSTGFGLSANGTTLTGLVIAGRSVRADAAPNTRVNLAGFGYVVVNEQIRKTNGLTVNGLHLHVTVANSLGAAIGTTVVVSNAVSALSGPVSGVVGGYAYGTKVQVGTVIGSGATFPVYLPCLGTRGALRTNTGAGLSLGTAVRTGTISDTVRGSVSVTSVTTEATSTVQSVNLLNGVVKASVVKADARGSRSGGTNSFNGTGSKFGALSVVGLPAINANVAPNTTVTVPGVGTLTLHKVSKTTRAVTVIMIELTLTSPLQGMAVGTVIRSGVASTSIG